MTTPSGQAQRDRIAQLEDALKRLHDQVDEINAEIADGTTPLCVVCSSREYDGQGIIHNTGCSLPLARIVLAEKEKP